MAARFLVLPLTLCILSSNGFAMNDNPFAKSESLQIGKNISWKISKEVALASKTVSDGKGAYYHLRFDNKQLTVVISSDGGGLKPKTFSQLEILNVQIGGQQSELFKWCLNNQQGHNRYLEQGLTVKKNICLVDGDAGSFVMQLDIDTLTALRNGAELQFTLKPYRTPLELHYETVDFNDMYVELNMQIKPVVVSGVRTMEAVDEPVKKCLAEPPAKYKNVTPVEYDCDSTVEKKEAEARFGKLVATENARQKKIAAEHAKQRKLAEQKKQQALADKLKQEKLLKAEAAAIAASEAKREQISQEITQKMLALCEKYWKKGEHRCYCQKYIEHAPGNIKANASCN